MVLLAVFGGLLLVGLLAVGILGYRFATSPTGERMVETFVDMRDVTKEAANAPGAKELRALGCTQAMVLDPAQVERVARHTQEAGAAVPSNGGAHVSLVVCSTGLFASKPPTCADVASTYVAALGGEAPSTFMVSVQTLGAPEVCHELFDVHGVPRATR